MKNVFQLILFILSAQSLATEQVDDELRITGSTFEIEEFPLRTYPEYKDLLKYFDQGSCSGNWRGYKAFWKIEGDELWLDQLRKDNPCSAKDNLYLDLPEVFGARATIKGLPAYWVSGTVSYRIGKTEQSADFAYYEYEAVIYEIEGGKIKDRKIRTVRIYRN